MSVFGSPSSTGDGARSATTVTTSGTLTTAKQDLLIVGVGWSDGGTCTGVTDTAGNAYVAGTAHLNATTGVLFQWFYCLAATKNSATNAFTAGFSQANNNVIIFAQDVPLSGGTAVFDVDVASDGSGDGTTASFSTTGTDEFVEVVGYDQFGTGGYVQATGYTLDSASFGTFGGAEHQVFSSPQTGITATFATFPSSCSAQAIGFKAAAPKKTGRGGRSK